MKKTRTSSTVTTLKHGKGKTHENDCGWLHGPNAHPDWNKYHEVPRASRQGKPHCRHC